MYDFYLHAMTCPARSPPRANPRVSGSQMQKRDWSLIVAIAGTIAFGLAIWNSVRP
jgi:hypothetical protein